MFVLYTFVCKVKKFGSSKINYKKIVTSIYVGNPYKYPYNTLINTIRVYSIKVYSVRVYSISYTLDSGLEALGLVMCLEYAIFRWIQSAIFLNYMAP